jgi:hypothetical protein
MGILWFLVFVAVGLVAGFYLTLAALCTVTVVLVTIGVVAFWKTREFERLFAMAYAVCAGIFLVSCWVGYFLSVGQGQKWFESVKNWAIR